MLMVECTEMGLMFCGLERIILISMEKIKKRICRGCEAGKEDKKGSYQNKRWIWKNGKRGDE